MSAWQHRKQRRSRLVEYCLWLLALVFLVPVAVAWGTRLLYVAEAEDAARAYPRHAEPSAAEHASTGDRNDREVIAKQDQSLWAKGRRAVFKTLFAQDAPAIAAVLSFPRLGSVVPVFQGATEKAMTLGAGHLSDTVALTGQGNIALSSHRDGAFRILKDIEENDEITLSVEGIVRRFIVKEMRIVEPTEIGVLAPTPVTTLTLITCYPFYFVGSAPDRYVVQAELVDG